MHPKSILPTNLETSMIASLVGVSALAYFLIPSRSANPKSPTEDAVGHATIDPAGATRARDAKEREREARLAAQPKREGLAPHPEHVDQEDSKPAFGRMHQQKRVDMPPDGRHHQSLQDRARERSQE